MAKKTLKMLGVHGLGDQRASDWKTKWPEAIRSVFPEFDGLSLDFEFVTYDDIFANTDISLAESVAALWKLSKSGIESIGHRERGFLGDVSEKVKWTAGYVVAWVEDKEFQKQSRKKILDAIKAYKPDIILAHSLGSLITYNAFSHKDALDDPEVAAILAKAKYITFGCQIANPFVIRNLTNGRVLPLKVNFWHHLYNKNDDVFTAPIRMPGVANFSQTDTPFDQPGVGDHSAEMYFTQSATVENVWRPIGAAAVGAKLMAFATTAKARAIKGPQRKARKALLVGINAYPNPAQQLEGCINDVFTMSSVLQECGFPPESIRTCLDDRATAEGILSRLKWLLDDPHPGDELVFYYSGHGARIPEYGENYEPDHYMETLVPWDFDWTPEKAISDDQIYGLYAQLPYDCRLALIFDCCQSGGMHRGSGRPRGLTPPDDIRHRELKWDSKTQMWVSRDFARINKNFSPDQAVEDTYFGQGGASERIGRASMLRGLSYKDYDQLKADEKALAQGPYLPLIIEACGEDELSYEYRHGATSHGAFTFSLASILRREKTISFEGLIKKTADQLSELQYDQTPQILGPSAVLAGKVPWASG